MADIERDESASLIASNKVEGTAVYNEEGEKLGSIYNFMVDKRSGQVEYAVLQFGGFLGMGSDYYPFPGKPSNTTKRKAVMLSTSIKRHWRKHRTFLPTKNQNSVGPTGLRFTAPTAWNTRVGP